MKVLDGIPYTIKRSQRKTISIYVERDGNISILAPKTITDDELEVAVTSKAYQIYKHLSTWEDINRTRIIREYVNGQSFLYLGRSYQLRFVAKQEVPLKLKNGCFLLCQSNKGQARQHFIHFYKTKGAAHLQRKIDYYKGLIGVIPQQIRIMELQYRWASCAPSGNINFHWKCLMAPGNVINYIVAHELTHLKHPDHSPAFWNALDKVMPNYQQHLMWLKVNGASLDL